MASGSNDYALRIWNADGSLKATCKGHAGNVGAVAWSADGARLASGSSDKNVSVSREVDGTAGGVFKGSTDAIITLAGSPMATIRVGRPGRHRKVVERRRQPKNRKLEARQNDSSRSLEPSGRKLARVLLRKMEAFIFGPSRPT